MTIKQAISKGNAMGKWARKSYNAVTLAAWAHEQSLKSDEAAKRGAEADAAMYAAAYMAASR